MHPTAEQSDLRASSSRRTLLSYLYGTTSAVAFLGVLPSGCAGTWEAGGPVTSISVSPVYAGDLKESYDYIVVGSGAGGGPVAANLALAGFSVLVIEAGGADEPYDYQVPAFHGRSTENDDMRWSFYVRHYADEARQRRDRKFVETADGAERNAILYPRAGTLGGCTAHNAMIMVYPHNSDWDLIAEMTGDPSWSADRMRVYFQRLERCQYVRPPFFGDDETRHGYDGWLTTTVADPKLLIGDKALKDLVRAAFKQSFAAYVSGPRSFVERVRARLESHLDPNDWRRVIQSFEGITFTPLTVDGGRRTGARERILQVMRAQPSNLTVKLNALVTRVLLDDDMRAVGVEFLDGAQLYRADPRAPKTGAASAAIPLKSVRAKREVILAAGAFNTPQILMLSGIGPASEMARHGIPVAVDLPGVGRNLQDRYEVGVVYEMKEDFSILEGATFRPPAPGEAPDPAFAQWLEGKGIYTTNGAIIAIVTRSHPSRPEPDLYLFGIAGYFEGYEPCYSERSTADKRHFTWAILKGHTNNTAGVVRLRSADPRDTPDINFHYFDEGNDVSGEDLASMVAGVEYVREITARTPYLFAGEKIPGPGVRTPAEIEQFVKDNAWGHHACGTCKIGQASDAMAVLDNEFRVRGTTGLRVVDASAFPSIPGFFIVSAVYMIAEKASDVILEAANTSSA